MAKKKKRRGEIVAATAEISALAGKSIPRRKLKQGEKGFTVQQFKGTPAAIKKRIADRRAKVAAANRRLDVIARKKQKIRAEATAKLKRLKKRKK